MPKKTTLKVMTNDQTLLFVEKPTLAAGDMNSVQLNVQFDSTWDKYVNRSATFYTSTDSTVYEMLLIDGACIIPHEVLADPCTMYVGVRGITEDGSALKTSTVVKCKIYEGAAISRDTAEPSPDLYMQYLTAMDGKVNPIIEAKVADSFNNISGTLNNRIEAELIKKNGDTMTGALTLASDPTSAMHAVTKQYADKFSKVRIKTGSYTGKGRAGVNNPTDEVECDFNIMMLVVVPKVEPTVAFDGMTMLHAIVGQEKATTGSGTAGDSQPIVKLIWEGNKVKWYATKNTTPQSDQLDEKDREYLWFVIGVDM